MKVIAINGSPNREGNTFHALNVVGEEIKAAGIGFELLHVGHKTIHGCIACRTCAVQLNEQCSINTDILNQSIQTFKEADGIILGAPVYFSGIPGTLKSFLDRLFFVSGVNGNLLRHKVAAAVVAVRRTGGSATLDSLYHYLAYAEMILATSNYWNVIHGRDAGEVMKDTEGVQIMRVLGKNMAWLLKMKEATIPALEAPKKEAKEAMNFIR